MAISYSGRIGLVTSSLTEAITAIASGQEPANAPLLDGRVEIRPVGAIDDVANGQFQVATTDVAKTLDPYRLMVTGKAHDPCSRQRARLMAEETNLEASLHEGLPAGTIQGLRATVTAAEQALEDCVEGSGEVSTDLVGALFRSHDLLRTGEVQEDGLRILIRVLDAQDFATIPGVRELITFDEIKVLAQTAIDEGGAPLTIRSISESNGRIRVSFEARRAITVRGHLLIALAPSTSTALNVFVEFTMIEADLHAAKGEIAERFFDFQRMARLAVNSVGRDFNSNVFEAIRLLRGPDGSLTIPRVTVTTEGVRLVASVGLMIGGHSDPCQVLRNLLNVDQRELDVAPHDGQSAANVAKLRERVRLARQKLDACYDQWGVN
jgi:hypothetical protein